MDLTSDKEKKPKKRGRKPKKQILDLATPKIDIKSEEEPLIAHLNINLDDVLDNKTETLESSALEEDSIISNSENESIFIKSEGEIKHFELNLNSSENKNIDVLEKEISRLKQELFKLTKNDKINVIKSSFNKNTKCWWCKNNFNTPSVGIPEIYFDNKFHCSGNFCSYNCAMAYNIDSGDNIWKRTSLLNLLYYKTYGKFSKIQAAPDWKTLKEYGGNLTIEEFRRNSIVNTEDYTLLHPPLETRVNTFEKVQKINNSSNSMYQKLLEDSDDLILKRNKPLKSSKYSLDNTLFIKKKERIRKMNKPITNDIAILN